jgi:hypothetical protein
MPRPTIRPLRVALCGLLLALVWSAPARAFDLHGQAYGAEAITRYLKLLGHLTGPTHRVSPDDLADALGDYAETARLPLDALDTDTGRVVLVTDLALDWAMKRGLAWRESVQRAPTRHGTLTIESFLIEASDPHLPGRVQRFWLGDRRVLVRPTSFFMCCDVDRVEEGPTDRIAISVNRRAAPCAAHTRRDLVIDARGAREVPVAGCGARAEGGTLPTLR